MHPGCITFKEAFFGLAALANDVTHSNVFLKGLATQCYDWDCIPAFT